MKKAILSLVAVSSLAIANNQVELNINNDTLEIVGDIYLNNIYQVSNDANYFFTANYLSSNKNSSITDKLMSAGLKIINPFADDKGLSLGLGIKAVIADDYTKSFSAAPLGLFAKYEFDEKIHFDAEVNYAPKTLSFSDANGYRDFKVKANYKLLDNGFAFVGTRMIKTSYSDDTSVNYDKSLFFGYKVQF